jgi:hypothetical protein
VQIRASYILPAIGLILFGIVTYNNFVVNRAVHRHPNKYFYWSGARLDTDPLNKHPKLQRQCEDGEEGDDCVAWDLLEMRSDPGWKARSLVLSALPAFAAGGLILFALGKLGVSQLVTFAVTMPPLLFAWYYFLGWLVDRAINKRFSRLNLSA